MKRSLTMLSLFIAVSSGAVCVHVGAQSYPNKAVRMVIPFAPGGTTDIVGRLLAQKMSAAWGQQVYIDNRAGANGIIGSDIVAHSSGDGYTLIIVAPGHASNVTLYSKLPYDTLNDFTPVSLLAVQPGILVLHPSVPARSVRELIALAHAKPGAIVYASGGSGSSQHLHTELFKSMAKIDVVHIPYKGSGPAEADLLAGQVSFMLASMISVLPHVKGGKLIALAVTTAKRSPAVPDLPTIAEAGVPGYAAVAWAGLLGPKGMPREVVAKLNAEVVRSMSLPDVQTRLAALGAEVQTGSPAQFDTFIRDEMKLWGDVVKRAGIKVE